MNDLSILRLSVEYATREVSCPSFTVKNLLLEFERLKLLFQIKRQTHLDVVLHDI